MRRGSVHLVGAVLALGGSVWSWLAAGSQEQVPPIAEGQPAMTSVVFYPPLVVLALFLLTVAGVLAVLGVARLRRTPQKGGSSGVWSDNGGGRQSAGSSSDS